MSNILDSKDYNDPNSVLYRGDLLNSGSGGNQKSKTNSSAYYDVSGSFLGYNTIDNNSIYISTQKLYIEGIKNPDNLRRDSYKLSVTHSYFKQCANILYWEGDSDDMTEYMYFAHTAHNAVSGAHKGKKYKNILQLLLTNYSSVPSDKKKDYLKENNSTSKANMARAGLIYFELGKPDPTGGTQFWDGYDVFVFGTKHHKISAGYEITRELYEEYLAIILKEYPKGTIRYDTTTYKIPNSIFEDSKNWSDGVFRYRTGSGNPQYIAKEIKGTSIFYLYNQD